jgi:hypothetical protein
MTTDYEGRNLGVEVVRTEEMVEHMQHQVEMLLEAGNCLWLEENQKAGEGEPFQVEKVGRVVAEEWRQWGSQKVEMVAGAEGAERQR